MPVRTDEELEQGFEVVNAVTGQPAALVMQGLWLTGRILPVGARLVVVHTFRSGESKPMEAVYAFGLPRDAALRRFTISGEGFKVRSELKLREEAQKEYEEGISRGHLAAMARGYRDGRVNLSVGNIRPGELVKVCLEMVAGVDLRDDGLRFRFPFTLAPCYHREARAIAVEPGVGEIELPGDQFGDLLLPSYLTDGKKLHAVSFDLAIDLGAPITSVASPSHALKITGVGSPAARVALSLEKDLPDRDLVLDAQTRETAPRVCGGPVGDGKRRVTVAVPSINFGTQPEQARSVVFVLDRSGSMQGEPMKQARKAALACLATLTDKDRFGLVAFDSQIEIFEPKLVPATMDKRQQAQSFLERIEARGGTELAAGIEAAVKMAGSDPADLFVLTDGQVSGTEDILKQVRGAGMRLHCLGIGSASQDRFLKMLAREAGGTSRFVTPRERVDLGALELFAGVGRVAAKGVKAVFPEDADARIIVTPPETVFEGHPYLLMAETIRPESAVLELKWGGERSGQLQIRLEPIGRSDPETVRLLQGARLITDLDAQVTGEVGTPGRFAEREHQRWLKKLENASREYGLASRAMSLVAVVERPGDDDSKVPPTKVEPVGLPQDVAFAAYFGEKRVDRLMATSQGIMAAPRPVLGDLVGRIEPRVRMGCPILPDSEEDDTCFLVQPAPPSITAGRQPSLIDLASALMPDGGLPGQDEASRLFKSVLLLAWFLLEGHTAHSGPFRKHVSRLADFVKARVDRLPDDQSRAAVNRILNEVSAGGGLPNDLLDVAQAWLVRPDAPVGDGWRALRKALA